MWYERPRQTVGVLGDDLARLPTGRRSTRPKMQMRGHICRPRICICHPAGVSPSRVVPILRGHGMLPALRAPWLCNLLRAAHQNVGTERPIQVQRLALLLRPGDSRDERDRPGDEAQGLCRLGGELGAAAQAEFGRLGGTVSDRARGNVESLRDRGEVAPTFRVQPEVIGHVAGRGRVCLRVPGWAVPAPCSRWAVHDQLPVASPPPAER